MSAPSSVKMSPTIPVDPRIRRKQLPYYLIQVWISLVPVVFVMYMFWAPYTAPLTIQHWFSQWVIFPIWAQLILIPFELIAFYYIAILWTAIITKIYLSWLTLLRKPKEGLFKRDIADKDYLYWNKRNMARIFLFWLIKTIPFPWGKVWFMFNFFGVKVGKNASITDCWICSEFLEIGDNVKIGQGACVYSFMMEPEKLLVAKVVIEDNVIVGPRTTIFAGVHIGARTIVSGGSFVLPCQDLEEDAIYFGNPAELIRKKTPEEL